MKKKIISDIRLFKSERQSEYGEYVTESFGDKKLNAVVTRIVMKLRENGFSLGGFDHLYINFTTCDVSESMILSDKEDRYHPWYRYCHVHVSRDLFQKLGSSEARCDTIHLIYTVLSVYFITEEFDGARILSCIRQAVEQGEDMLMRFKEKLTSKRKAVILLRVLDSCKYGPLLKVYDAEGNLLFEKDLPESVTLDHLGDIQVSTKRVMVKPRKNAINAQTYPFVFEY